MSKKSLNPERRPLHLKIYNNRVSFPDPDEFCKHEKYKTKVISSKEVLLLLSNTL